MANVFAGLLQRFGPVPSAVAAALFVILGVLVISHPLLLVWLVGIGLVLVGVAVFAFVLTSRARSVP